MIISVAREHHWAPEVLGALYFDAEDYMGLRFWFEDIKEVDKAIKNSTKP
jgi:hypothetical protein